MKLYGGAAERGSKPKKPGSGVTACVKWILEVYNPPQASEGYVRQFVTTSMRMKDGVWKWAEAVYENGESRLATRVQVTNTVTRR